MSDFNDLFNRIVKLNNQGYGLCLDFWEDGFMKLRVAGGDCMCSHDKAFDPKDTHGFTCVSEQLDLFHPNTDAIFNMEETCEVINKQIDKVLAIKERTG